MLRTNSSPSLEYEPLPGSGASSHRRMGKILVAVGVAVATMLFFFGSTTQDAVVSDTSEQPSLRTIGKSRVDSFTHLHSDYPVQEDGERDLLQYCDELYFEQPLDHFSANDEGTFLQRYFVCGEEHSKKDGSIFFYVGNEADVELYLNNTGLMWENAKEFGALMVFAEHRYFGKSLPFPKDEIMQHMRYLSTEQALADYAVLITNLKASRQLDVPVIGFGGSYGGMLGTWFRIKYPHIIDGVIAASAPVVRYYGDELPMDTEGYARVVTFDASPEAGASPHCIPNVRKAWPTMAALGNSSHGRSVLHSALGLCESQKLNSAEDVAELIQWAQGAYDMLAMGNYPYPSPYIMNGQSVLPSFPMREACAPFTEEMQGEELLTALRESVGVYYNSTHDAQCYSVSEPSNETSMDGLFWDYIWCSEIYMPQTMDGINDMFWPEPASTEKDALHCKEAWGVELKPHWAVTQYGGYKAISYASNIVFSNGNFDPWSPLGVLEDVSETVVAVPVDGGAHHLDLFFSNELDPPAVKHARDLEKKHMWQWVGEYYTRKVSLAAA